MKTLLYLSGWFCKQELDDSCTLACRPDCCGGITCVPFLGHQAQWQEMLMSGMTHGSHCHVFLLSRFGGGTKVMPHIHRHQHPSVHRWREFGKKSSVCSSCRVTRLSSDDRNTRRCLVEKTCPKVRTGYKKKSCRDKNSGTWATCHMTAEVGAVLTWGTCMYTHLMLLSHSTSSTTTRWSPDVVEW